jgi:hypothetical protein
MKITRIGRLIYAYQTDSYFQVHQHAIKTIIKLENLYIPLMICRESLKSHEPIIIRDNDVKVWAEPPFILSTQDKWMC